MSALGITHGLGTFVERETCIARVKASRFEVYMGADGQIFRRVTSEDRQKKVNQDLRLGQITVAASGPAAVEFLQSHCVASDVRERWIIRNKYKGVKY